MQDALNNQSPKGRENQRRLSPGVNSGANLSGADTLLDAFLNLLGCPFRLCVDICEGRIDHVFVTHDLVPKVKKAWIGYDIKASDHWPVFVDFDL